jgi:hypothetical protein
VKWIAHRGGDDDKVITKMTGPANKPALSFQDDNRRRAKPFAGRCAMRSAWDCWIREARRWKCYRRCDLNFTVLRDLPPKIGLGFLL